MFLVLFCSITAQISHFLEIELMRLTELPSYTTKKQMVGQKSIISFVVLRRFSVQYKRYKLSFNSYEHYFELKTHLDICKLNIYTVHEEKIRKKKAWSQAKVGGPTLTYCCARPSRSCQPVPIYVNLQ